MLLSLEVLRARHGDCLLLHYGNPDAPELILIDGGPARVYGTTLRPRLEELRARLADPGGPLPITLAMVSHIDDDHIRGLLDLTGELLEGRDAGREPFVDVSRFWHNSFNDVVGDETDLHALMGTDTAEALSTSGDVPRFIRSAAAVVASVNQGRQLRNEVELLGWPVNEPFAGLVSAPDRGGREVSLDDETSLLVLAPREEQLEDLRDEWDEQLRKLAKRQADEASVAAYVDESVFNLSSIVCLVRAADRSLLLTGDARGDQILTSLDAAGVTDGGRLHVDVLKLPHHGSDRNVDTDFFTRITADHYVVSGDGRHHNPETATLQMLCESRRGDDDFTIHLTYESGVGDLGDRLQTFFESQRAAGRAFRVEFPAEGAHSLRIDLLDPLPD